MMRALSVILMVAFLAMPGCKSAPLVDEREAARALGRAKRLYQEGDFKAARVAFQTYRGGQTEPGRLAEGYYWEGMCLLAQREFAGAREKFELALKRKPRGWVAAYILCAFGESLVGLGEFAAAEEAYSKALLTSPEDIRLDHVLLRLATCAQRLAQWEEADKHLNRLLTELPGSPLADQAREKFAFGKRKFFTVQVGAFKSGEAARACAAGLKKEGLKPFVRQIERGGEQFHCVCIGRFESWREATLAMQRIRGQARVENAIVKP